MNRILAAFIIIASIFITVKSNAQGIDITGVANPQFVIDGDNFSTLSFTSEEFVASNGRPKGEEKTIRVATVTADGGLANVSIQKTEGYLKKSGASDCAQGASSNCVRYVATANWFASTTVTAVVDANNTVNPSISTQVATGPGPLKLTIAPVDNNQVLLTGTYSDIVIIKVGDDL